MVRCNACATASSVEIVGDPSPARSRCIVCIRKPVSLASRYEVNLRRRASACNAATTLDWISGGRLAMADHYTDPSVDFMPIYQHRWAGASPG